MRSIGSALAPCPVCRSEIHTLGRINGRWWFKCGFCGAEIPATARVEKVATNPRPQTCPVPLRGVG